MIETGAPNRGVLWRSSDGGDNWALVSYDRLLNERSHYAGRILVNPADENEIYFNANSHSISYDGGVTTDQRRARIGVHAYVAGITHQEKRG